MNLTTLQTEVAEWAGRNFPNAQPHQPLLGISEEAGELCHAHLKMEQGIRGTHAEHQAAKRDAIGDLFIFAAHYCVLNNIDLASAVQETWDIVNRRDWQKNKESGKA